ncbi:MAG: 5'/3'-nucleotidase SurE [Candidatus Cloacimonadota bacterium]
MRILLTNDDGIQAEGLQSMARSLREAGHEILIVAPDGQRSASSHSISLHRDIAVRKLADEVYEVNGTPVDCVVVALQKINTKPVDLVISGVNAGQNMGEDILYSGTVAAATEAALLGYKAIAASICSYADQFYETSAWWIPRLLELGLHDLIQHLEVYNVNFPNLPKEQIKGMRLTQTGHRKYYNFIKITSEDKSGFSYQIGGDKPVWEVAKGTDAEAISEGYISITPLGFDLTRGEAFPGILNWLEEKELLKF